jgi:mono/diheme cytochrome c family protein
MTSRPIELVQSSFDLVSSILFTTTITLILVCVTSATSQAQSTTAANAQLEHGRYLVQRVGLCGDCHTPHDDHGQPIGAKALQGAGLTFKPLGPVPNWVEYAPPLVGLLGFTDAQMITFLTTGKDATGKSPRPPMPAYRFNKKDAAAVVAYLRSLSK